MEWKILILFSILALCGFVCGVRDQRSQIRFDLFSGDYDHTFMPASSNETLRVQFGLHLKQINEVEESSNSISVMVLMTMTFTDHRLQWDPDQYDGVTKITLPFNKLWLPDITLYNRISGTEFSSQQISAIVDNTGHVFAIAPMQLTASCEMDLAFFPYDKQRCALKFGSWLHDRSEFDLALLNDNVDINMYCPHLEYELSNVTFKLHGDAYPNGKVYQDATAFLELTRRSAPYTVKLVIPSVLTAFLILFTFILSSSSGEKIVFCLILLLSLILLSVYLHILVPSNTESVLGEFLTFALFLDFFATIIAVICYNVAEALVMRDRLGGAESEKHYTSRKRKLKALRMAEYGIFFAFLLVFIIGAAIILRRRG